MNGMELFEQAIPSSDCTAFQYFLSCKAHEGIKASTYTGYFNTLHSEKWAGIGKWLWLKRISRAANENSHVSWNWKHWWRKAVLLINIADTHSLLQLWYRRRGRRVVGLESEHWLLHLLLSLGISNFKVLTLLPIIKPALLITVTLKICFLLFILNSIPEDFAGLGWQCLIFAETISELSHRCIFWHQMSWHIRHLKKVLFFIGILVGFLKSLRLYSVIICQTNWKESSYFSSSHLDVMITLRHN